MKTLTEVEVLQLLQRRIAQDGSQKALAERMKISPGYLNDVLQGKRRPGRKLLTAMGLKAVIVYVEIK